ncbi:MAG: hypothetical protein HY221_00845 [Candidatus Sungbacteria bacterium]|uniref:Uncharacterized protein n=1 Tax=Candidatus Sungiibacteriota bacterium TaxID=2750080 RepID=A0A932VRN3_9BACT|nr:hypothetical protein [Candidatus Sungbacteria bacterium]
MRKHARAIGNGIDDIVGQRPTGCRRIQPRQVADPLGHFMISACGVARDAQAADNFTRGIVSGTPPPNVMTPPAILWDSYVRYSRDCILYKEPIRLPLG